MSAEAARIRAGLAQRLLASKRANGQNDAQPVSLAPVVFIREYGMHHLLACNVVVIEWRICSLARFLQAQTVDAAHAVPVAGIGRPAALFLP